MTDEQRTDSLGCYGSPWARTPNLDRLASEGVRFSSAYTPAPLCAPARAAMITGRYPSSTGIWYNEQDTPSPKSLMSLFTDAGYHTASFGKQHYQCSDQAFETEKQLVWAPEVHALHYAKKYDGDAFGKIQYPPEPYPWIFGGRFPESADRTTEAQSVKEAMTWLKKHPDQAPFFLRVSFNGPHTPVVPPEPFDRLIDSEDVVFPPETESSSRAEPRWITESLRRTSDASRLTRDQIRRMRRYYYGEVAFLDQQFGILLDWMRDRGLLDNTIIVYLSDHGTHLGDYGLVQKQTFYEPVVTVPVVFCYPGKFAAGTAIKRPVGLISLFPTLFDLAGLSIPGCCEGVSLSDSLHRGAEPDARPVFSEFTLGSFEMRPNDRLVMVREGQWKLSLCMDPKPHDEVLCNLEQDPYEQHNLYGQKETKSIQNRLVKLITNHLAHKACQGTA